MQPSPSDHAPHAPNPSVNAGGHAARLPEKSIQADFSGWVAATCDPAELKLSEAGFGYADLFVPARLAELTARFDAFFSAADAAGHARFAAYRERKGEGMKPEEVSEALLAGAPHLARFVTRLFGVEREAQALMDAANGRAVLWHFKKE